MSRYGRYRTEEGVRTTWLRNDPYVPAKDAPGKYKMIFAFDDLNKFKEILENKYGKTEYKNHILQRFYYKLRAASEGKLYFKGHPESHHNPLDYHKRGNYHDVDIISCTYGILELRILDDNYSDTCIRFYFSEPIRDPLKRVFFIKAFDKSRNGDKIMIDTQNQDSQCCQSILDKYLDIEFQVA